MCSRFIHRGHHSRLRSARLSSVVIFIALSLSACNPGYYLRAAYEGGKILVNREKISTVLEEPDTTPLERQKLQLVLDARDFAVTMGLKPEGSFTRFTRVDKDVLAWVVMGARPDSFELYTWWFPIVGRVPYKGFFTEAGALKAAESLTNQGFETWVRGTDAMSTLGWFDDPVLSTVLRYDDSRLVNVVLHETTHSTVWVPNHVPFNESLANFIGARATVDFYLARHRRCQEEKRECQGSQREVDVARADLDAELTIAASVMALYDELNALYTSSASREEKLLRRHDIFTSRIAALRSRYPKMKILSKVNNAELMQLKIYMTNLHLFERLFLRCKEQWGPFLEEIQRIADAESSDPFSLLTVAAGEEGKSTTS